MIQKLWNYYIDLNPTNNVMERKIRREAFFAGAESMREQITQEERLANDYLGGSPLEIVGGSDYEE